MIRKTNILLALLLTVTVGGASVRAQYREDLPSDAGPAIAVPNPVITEKTNAQIPLDLAFKDSTGKDVRLGDYFHHNKPVVLSLVYFSCPMLCGINQTGLVGAVKNGPDGLTLGKDYEILVVSIDPDDTPTAAAAKRANYLQLINRPDSQPGFTYLTGSEDNIKTLADTIGFGYHKNINPDATTGKYAHSTGYFICTPDAKLAQTIGGIDLPPDELHNSLINASNGKLTRGFVYTVAFACGAMRFNPLTGKYEQNPWFYAGTAGGIVSILFMATLLTLLFRSDAKRKIAEPKIPNLEPTTQDSGQNK